MWIDRLDDRLSAAFHDLRHPGYVMAGSVAAGVVMLALFTLVVSAQVERGQARSQEEAAARAQLWRCNALPAGLAAERCRQLARGEASASPLVSWDSLAPVNAPAAAGGVMPVGLTR